MSRREDPAPSREFCQDSARCGMVLAARPLLWGNALCLDIPNHPNPL